MKRLIIFFVVVIGVILLGLWSPWIGWSINLSQIFGVEQPDSISGLQVFSLGGEMEIIFDGESKGTISVEESPFFVDAIEPGLHLLNLRRVSETEGAYWEFNKLIDFEEGVDVVVAYNLGPEEEFSEGHIVFAGKNEDNSENLVVSVNTEDATVFLDDQELSVTDNEEGQSIATGDVSLDSQHVIRIEKTGFETTEFTILPEEQEDRNRLEGFLISVEAQMFVQPVTVE